MRLMTKFITAFLVLMLTACNGEASDRYIVKTASPAEVSSVIAHEGGEIVRTVPKIGILVMKVPEHARDKVMAALSRNPHIEYVEPDLIVAPDDLVPNDPRYPDQWHLHTINAAEAWQGGSGSGQVIAILDTGVDGTHQELIGRVRPGFNAVDGSSDVTDVHGHGTAVAGTAVAGTGNGLDIAAVAWSAEILPVKITNQVDGWAYHSDMAAGMIWAADQGATVVNLSYSNVYRSMATTDAAEYVRSRGGLVVVSAGNDGTGDDCDTPYDYSNASMMIVGATASNDTKPSWGNCGPHLDVSAPGQGILTLRSGGGLRSISGTSFSSPLTAGTLATMWSANPALSGDEVVQALLDSAVDLGDPGIDNVYGHGRIDAAAAMARVLSTVPAPEPTPEPEPAPTVTVSIVSPADQEVVRGRFNLRMIATGDSPVMVYRCYLNGELARERIYPRDQRDQSVDCGISSRQWPNGTYTATTEAQDDTGATAAASITVTVQN